MADEELIPLALDEAVAAGHIAGASVSVWRAGETVYAGGTGFADVEQRSPCGRDTLYRIASMSKAMTHVAALRSWELGLFDLDQPITEAAPELSAMRVLRTPTSSLDDVEPAARPLTFRDLMGHRAGMTYGSFHEGTALGRAHRAALGAEIDSERTPDEWIAGLATLPLLAQPGAAFSYGHATDLLGLLLARLHRAALDEVLHELVWDPLGLVDTSFVVPAEKRTRCAALHGFDAAGHIVRRTVAAGGATVAERPASMTYLSGGQGLWSTVDDFSIFAQLFVMNGEAGGTRLLTPESLALLTTNQMTPDQRQAARMMGRPMFATGHGYSLGLAVVVEPDDADPFVCGGAKGAVGWPGAFGGWWRADPANETVIVFLTHNIVEPAQMAQGIGLGVYDVIDQVQALAAG